MKRLLSKNTTKPVKSIIVDLARLVVESTKLEKSYIMEYGGLKKSNSVKATLKIPSQSINNILEESSANKKFDFY